MNTTPPLFVAIELFTGLPLWIILIPLGVMMADLVYSWIRIRILKDQKAELESVVLERTELLAFSTEREKKANDQVELVNKNKRNLLSRINHEIRTPMNGMIGMATLLAQTPLNSEQQEYNETIRTCGTNLISTINSILHGDVLMDHREPVPNSAVPNVQTKDYKLSADFSRQYPLRILIAEDDLINQKLAVKILGKLGYSADIAHNGKEVLEVISNTNYDLIFMDVQMPEMDGLEATRMIRLCIEVQPVIIAMTANSMQGDREKCLLAGMDDYISKPVHLEELMIKLEKWALHVKSRKN